MLKPMSNRTKNEQLARAIGQPDGGENIVIVNPLSPVMTESMFARVSGLTPGEVRGQADRDNLPTIRYGRKRLINIRQIERDCEGR